jgi:hypothetical protein
MALPKQVLVSNLKLDVILLVYKCDLALVFVMSHCCGGCHILASSRMAGCSLDGCQILTGSRMEPASRQVTVGVAYVSVTDVN